MVHICPQRLFNEYTVYDKNKTATQKYLDFILDQKSYESQVTLTNKHF